MFKLTDFDENIMKVNVVIKIFKILLYPKKYQPGGDRTRNQMVTNICTVLYCMMSLLYFQKTELR